MVPESRMLPAVMLVEMDPPVDWRFAKVVFVPLVIEIEPAKPEPFNIETESNPDVPRLAVMVPAARMNDSEAFPP